MKKTLLTFIIAAICIAGAKGQTRMTLHEEFTGENCGPCAGTNPGFWALCDAAINTSKLIHISYMVPIPSPGFYCDRTTAIYTSRDTYYGIAFAPDGRYDGAVPDPSSGTPGHPGYFVQADIDAEAARADSFSFSPFTCAWNATYDSIVTTITITAGSTGWTGTTPVLRLALVQTNDFASSPGTNGEIHFENVVQAMYPDVNGTTMPASWAPSSSHTYTITGAVPTYVDKSKSPYMVAWLQDEGNKNIAQSGQTVALTIPLDIALNAVPATNCVSGASGSVIPVVTLKNPATTTLTSATVYYKIDGGAMMSQPWTGSIATGATASFSLPATTLTTGSHTIYDSVAAPNGSTDINVVNNAANTIMLVQSTTPTALPMATDFEAALPPNWTLFDANGNGENWAVTSVPNHATGSKAAKHDNYAYPSGEANYIILPTPTVANHTLLSFWVADAQYAAENDMLEVVSSTDCGANWTAIWTKSGATLATAPLTTSPFTPTATQWRQETQDISSLPAGAMLALRATSDYGNNLYVDDINVYSAAGVNQISSSLSATCIYPNPAKDAATLSFTLAGQADVQIKIVDGLGRTMSMVADEQMNSGAHAISINTATLATGVYNVMIHTNTGTTTERLSVVR